MAKAKRKMSARGAEDAALSRQRGKKPGAPPTAHAMPAADSTGAIAEGRIRAVIDSVQPAIDGGRFPVKGIAGESLAVTAHCFADSHDKIRVLLRWQALAAGPEAVAETPMRPVGNDVWEGEFTPPAPGRYRYTVLAYVDHFESWRSDLARREERADIEVALHVGSGLVQAAAARAAVPAVAAAAAAGADAANLRGWAAQLQAVAGDPAAEVAVQKALGDDPARAVIVAKYADTSLAASHSLELVADRKRAAFSTWYELFPRSTAAQAGRHGTFRDVEAQLPRIAAMGFDVLYFPPIHPIGRSNRKGKNNALRAADGDVGSPWAIGAQEGGHKDILADLGDYEDFAALVAKAREHGLEIAMDIAFQCAPDHPYVQQHPSWFKHRPDGSVQYAENPPKKYQDIYPFDFESSDWRALWSELRSVFGFWVERGVKIFRVDNPHTKALPFWEWVIGEIKRDDPDVLFLAEAFTRPKVMHRLAKLGFSQSYTYFTWRNSKYELTEYFTELARGPGRDYFRPNIWPNTPDILPESLQTGLRQVFAARLVLAATLAGNYGIYGPAFELLESTAREPGSEEYRDSEKYQLRHWQLDRPDGLESLVTRLNHIRRDNPALQADRSLQFCRIENEQLLAYVKFDAASGNAVLTVVNLDPYHAQSGWVELDLEALQFNIDQPFQVHDLLSDQRFVWRGRHNYIQLEPQRAPAHVLRLRHQLRREQDFDYFA